ncbi:TPA: hypothetical protein EYP44_05100 [Candidatus Bathyarchaeota archaeon]|nr:hypothetical protein [Candidatus Bathyarchaeota archaeon]
MRGDVGVEIICVGNELLIGKVLNTNAQWLCKRITDVGAKVARITVVGDELGAISSAIREAVSRGPEYIITTGGLGPTSDDKTLQGVAMGLGVGLELNDRALRMIRERYEEYARMAVVEKPEMTEPRRKMAMLPRGATPIPNPVGTAPGSLIEHRGIRIISLPGVPKEMVAMFDASILPLIRGRVGKAAVYEASFAIRGLVESSLAPLIDKVAREFPGVYIKSHPGRVIRIHVMASGKEREGVRRRVEGVCSRLKELVSEEGGVVD